MSNQTLTAPDAGQKDKVRSFFDESKPWQGDLYEREETYFSRVIRRRKEYAMEMVRRLGLPPGAQVLDIGCGSGAYLQELINFGYEATGVDVSEAMLASSRERVGPAAAAKVHLVQGDVEHLPLPNGRFDLVLCIGVFGYLLSDEKAQEEILRVLKPGGHLLLNLTNMYSLSDADYVLRVKVRELVRPSLAVARRAQPAYAFPSPWMSTHRGYFFKAYNVRMYERVLRAKGLQRVEAMTYGFEFRVLRRLRVIPARWLNAFELWLERVNSKLPILAYAGWVYTGVFRKS